MLCAQCNEQGATVELPSGERWCMSCTAALAFMGQGVKKRGKRQGQRYPVRTAVLTALGREVSDQLRQDKE